MSGGHQWYANPQQQGLLENMMFCVIALLALLFEHFHHVAEHRIQHISHEGDHEMNEIYGMKHHRTKAEFREGNVMGMTRHSKRIWAKLSEELMVLGFISSLIWLIEQFGGFESISDDLKDDYHYYPDETSLIHTVHNVHEWIFFGMCLHFVVAVGLTYTCVHSSQVLVSDMEKRVFYNETPDTTEHRLQRYAHVRKVFLAHHAANKEMLKEYDMEVEVDTNFIFSLYLTLNQDRMLTEFYNFKPDTWLFIFLFKLIEASVLAATLDIHSYKWGIEFSMDLMLALSGILFAIGCLTLSYIRKRRVMECDAFPKEPPFQCCRNASDPEFTSREITLCHAIQAFSFAMCYQVASTIGKKSFWEATDIDQYPFGKGTLHAIWTVLCAFSLVAFCVLLTYAFPVISYDFCLPPNMDVHHYALMKQTCLKQPSVRKLWASEKPQSALIQLTAETDRGGELMVSTGADKATEDRD